MTRIIEVTDAEHKFKPFALVIESEDELRELYLRLNASVNGVGTSVCVSGESLDDISMPMYELLKNKCIDYGIYKEE